MIGKGAQYLTAAGFGRYRITAASLGSNLMFGSLWLNYAAQQAIIAAFGATDGTAVIRATNEYLNGIAASDKAKATALAGFINEDPMMVCSLGLEPTLTTLSAMPIRYAVNDTNAYATAGKYNVTNNSFMRIRTKVLTATGTYPCMFRLSDPYDKSMCIWLSNASFVGFMYGGSEYLSIASFDNNVHTFEIKGTDFSIDGVLKRSATAKTFTNTNPTSDVAIGAMANGQRWNKEQVQFAEYGEGDNISHKLIPFKSNDVVYLRDIETGDYATMVGTWQEKFYLPDGTEWTPPTP